MSLPEDEVDVVQAFEGIISPDSLLMESSGEDVWESGTPGWMLLPAKTYVFADKIDCEVVRAYILRSLGEVVLANPRREYIEKEVVELAFAGLPPGALRRQFLVDLSVLVCTPSRIGDVAGEFHNEFVAAVLYLMQVRYLALKAGKRILMHWGKYVPAKTNEAEGLFRFGYGKCKDVEVFCEKNLEKYVGTKGVAVLVGLGFGKGLVRRSRRVPRYAMSLLRND